MLVPNHTYTSFNHFYQNSYHLRPDLFFSIRNQGEGYFPLQTRFVLSLRNNNKIESFINKSGFLLSSLDNSYISFIDDVSEKIEVKLVLEEEIHDCSRIFFKEDQGFWSKQL